MANDRLNGIQLILGSVGVVLTLSLHPDGRELFSPDTYASAAFRTTAVHSIALAALPLWFLGALGLARRIRPSSDNLGIAGAVLYGFAIVAMLNALVVDGLVTPLVAGKIVQEAAPIKDMWKAVLRYNGMVDMCFIYVYLAASSVAVGLWSIAMLRSRDLSRSLGAFGALIAVVALGALLSGLMSRHMHVFSGAILLQALWFAIAGGWLWRVRTS